MLRPSPEELLQQLKAKFEHCYLLKVQPHAQERDDSDFVPDYWADHYRECLELDRLSEEVLKKKQAHQQSAGNTQKKLPPAPPLKSSTSPLTVDLPHPTSDESSKEPQQSPYKVSKKNFKALSDFVNTYLIPSVAQKMASDIKEWDKEVASNRRGISARLLKVGLKYFGSSSSSSGSSSGSGQQPIIEGGKTM
jgi:hypothetical protein